MEIQKLERSLLIHKLIILFAISFIIVTCIISLSVFDKKDSQLIKLETDIKNLKSIITEEGIAKEQEIKVRDSLRFKDSILITKLILMKRRDSLNQIRTIRELMKGYEKMTDKELDQELIKEYEKSINN